MEVRYEEALKEAKDEARKEAKLFWPESEKEKIKEKERELTWRKFRELIAP